MPPTDALTVAAAAKVPAWKENEPTVPVTPLRSRVARELLPVVEFVPVEVAGNAVVLARVSRLEIVKLPGVVTVSDLRPVSTKPIVVVPVANMFDCVIANVSTPETPSVPML